MKKEWVNGCTWNRRYKEMQDAIHTVEGRKEIVETLLFMQQNKDLSYGERKMLDLAQNYETRAQEHAEKVIKIEDYLKARGIK